MDKIAYANLIINEIKANHDTNDEFDFSIEKYAVVNNSNKTVICARHKNSDNSLRTMGANIDVSTPYELKIPVNEAAEGIWRHLLKIQPTQDDIDATELFFNQILPDINNHKDLIYGVLINTEFNAKFLTEHPYTQICDDLAVIYKVNLGKIIGIDEYSPKGCPTIPVTNQLLKAMNITKDELHDICMENLSKEPYVMKPLGDVMLEMEPMQAIVKDMESETGCSTAMAKQTVANMFGLYQNPMRIIYKEDSNKHAAQYGAIGILRKDLLDDIMSDFQVSQLLILPSSLHEILVLPYYNLNDPDNDTNPCDVDDVGELIREVNNTKLASTDRLADHPYIYSNNGLIAAYDL